MELKAYWNVIKRRWLLVLIPTAVVLIIGLATYSPPGTAYNAGIRFIVSQEPSEAAAEDDEQRLANWQTSEYIVNGLTDWVRSGQFAQLVSARLAESGTNIDYRAIRGSIAADNVRSMMTFSMTFGDPAALEAMMRTAAAVLTEENEKGLPQLGGETAALVQLDEPIINPVSAGLFDQLQLPIRVVLAIAAGLGLAFLVDYLDPTVRERKELEAMGLPVMGEIPKK
jgi:capsular polysaccharide biosynthesis protein